MALSRVPHGVLTFLWDMQDFVIPGEAPARYALLSPSLLAFPIDSLLR
ncbi:MAG: hypothetical protein HW385_753 [candidate division NC10 bacterium]|nr:hypothetical protein [candidate division NC10 bacterium]